MNAVNVCNIATLFFSEVCLSRGLACGFTGPKKPLGEMGVHIDEETRELPGERDNARNNARWTQARKATHGLDGQHQDVDRTPRVRVSQNVRGQR